MSRTVSFRCDRCRDEIKTGGVKNAYVRIGGNGSALTDFGGNRDFCDTCWKNICVVISEAIKAIK